MEVQGTQGTWLGEGVVRARVRRGTGWGVTPGYAESPAGEVQGTQKGEVQGTQGREVQGTQRGEVQGTQRARTLWRIEVRP